MDKRALASIGNAYADEILFAAGIHPKTFCRKLEPAAVDALYGAIGRVLTEAIAEIRRRNEPPEVKVRDFLKVRGRDGKPCLVCGTTIRAVRVGDGDACFCPDLPARNAQAVRQLVGPESAQSVEEQAGGRCNVQRVGAGRHRDRDPVVAGAARRRR